MLNHKSELLIRQPALLGGSLGVLLLQGGHEVALEPED